MSRLARRGASLIAVVLTLVFVPIGVGAAWFAMSAPAGNTGPVTDLRVALTRAGLGAESLTAAGLSAQETTAVVGAFATAMANDPDALEQADADYIAARVAQDALQRKVRSGLATPEEVSALAAAKSALTSAQAAREHVLSGLFEDATEGLSNAEIEHTTAPRLR